MLTVKLLAKDNLSVQVHPDNDYAMRVEGEYGKTEMWYVVDCDEGATLLYGFKHEITKEEFARRIADNTLLEVTNAVPVKKGDVFSAAGTLMPRIVVNSLSRPMRSYTFSLSHGSN